MTLIPCPGLPNDIYPCPARIAPDHSIFCSTCKVRAKKAGIETRTQTEIEWQAREKARAARAKANRRQEKKR